MRTYCRSKCTPNADPPALSTLSPGNELNNKAEQPFASGFPTEQAVPMEGEAMRTYCRSKYMPNTDPCALSTSSPGYELNNEAEQPFDSGFTTEQAVPTEEPLDASFTVSLGGQRDSEEPTSSSCDSEDDDYSLTAEDLQSVWKDWLKQLAT